MPPLEMVKVPPVQLFQCQLVLLSAAGEIGDGLLDVREAQALGAAQHRHHQALAAAHGHADVEVVAVDDGVALVIDARIDGGELLERFDCRLHEEGHHAQLDAVPGLELLLHAAAQAA